MKKIIVLIMVVVFFTGCSRKAELSDIKAVSLDFDMGIGWNLGNSLDAASNEKGYFFETETLWFNPNTTKEMIKTVKDAGFKSIRIPVSFLNHIDADLKIDDLWLDRVEEIVQWCLEYDLITIINTHHDTSMNSSLNWIYADKDNLDDNINKLTILWEQIAHRFRDYDLRLIFQGSGEWMNPENSWDNEEDFKVVHDLNQAFIDVVRKSGSNNQDRYLMISPFGASAKANICEAMFFKEFKGDHLILSVHSYQLNVDEIYKGAQELAEISNKYNIPVVVDEFGPSLKKSNYENAQMLKAYKMASDHYGIGLMLWDDGFEYHIIDRERNRVYDQKTINILLKE